MLTTCMTFIFCVFTPSASVSSGGLLQALETFRRKPSLGMAPSNRFKLMLAVAMLLMLTPSLLYLAGPLRRPLLFKGDRLVELEAHKVGERWVPYQNGRQDSSSRGRKVWFVLPGPHRPVRFVGKVVSKAGNLLEGIQITLKTQDGTEIVRVTDSQGRFGYDLPPGRYYLAFNMSGKTVLKEELKVPRYYDPLPAEPVEQAWKEIEHTFVLGGDS